MMGRDLCRRQSTERQTSECAPHHVQLLVGRGKVQRGTGAIILGHEVGIRVHDQRQLLRVSQPDRRVEGEGSMPGLWRVPATIKCRHPHVNNILRVDCRFC